MSARIGRFATPGAGAMVAALLVAAVPAHTLVASNAAQPASRLAIAAPQQHISVTAVAKTQSVDFDLLGIHRYP